MGTSGAVSSGGAIRYVAWSDPKSVNPLSWSSIGWDYPDVYANEGDFTIYSVDYIEPPSAGVYWVQYHVIFGTDISGTFRAASLSTQGVTYQQSITSSLVASVGTAGDGSVHVAGSRAHRIPGNGNYDDRLKISIYHDADIALSVRANISIERIGD